MTPVRVLVTDDDGVTRRLVKQFLAEDPEVEVVGTARHGREVLDQVTPTRAEVVILDLEMPVMDGLQTVEVLQARHPDVAVIMFSSFTRRGAVHTLQALARGAKDYVTKPTGGGPAEARQAVHSQLLPKIKALGRPVSEPCAAQACPIRPGRTAVGTGRRPQRPAVLVMGASTGGPQALERVLADLPGDFPLPLLIVQHMPEMFTTLFAQRLDRTAEIDVVEGHPGCVVRPGLAVVARGDYHMELGRTEGGAIALQFNQGPRENYCRPAADRLFLTAAQLFGPRVLAAVLSGMGQDGLRGCQAIHAAGGQVLAQDQATSAVWGMPGAVAQAGCADAIVALDQMAAALTQRALAHNVGNAAGKLQGRQA